ncbi:DUF456 domain-containing protein [bacterium]|nr:DUF456 domain-containing protein [bacterium]
MEILSSIVEYASYFLALIGVLITLVGLPGIWVIFTSVMMWGVSTGFEQLTVQWILLFLAITLASTFIDNLTIILGAKKSGASNWGIVGAIVGMMIGTLVGNIPGMIIGAFVGAVMVEVFIAKKEGSEAIKAGIGTMVGFFLGILLKFVVAILMIYLWAVLAK